MAQSQEPPFLTAANLLVRAVQADFHARLLGYENALIAIIAALDRTGALPSAAAKSSVDGVIAATPTDPPNAPQLEVLRRIADRLAAPAPPPGQRH